MGTQKQFSTVDEADVVEHAERLQIREVLLSNLVAVKAEIHRAKHLLEQQEHQIDLIWEFIEEQWD